MKSRNRGFVIDRGVRFESFRKRFATMLRKGGKFIANL
jgi:hypothetical protein